MKPQNISVTSDDRRLCGEYSEVNVIAVGMAPPNPTPVRNRSQVSDERFQLNDDATAALPKARIETTSMVLRPYRSVTGPMANAPTIKPKSPAAKSGPSCCTPRFHSARMAGAMNPMMAVSNPSIATTKKQSAISSRWTGDTACVSMKS